MQYCASLVCVCELFGKCDKNNSREFVSSQQLPNACLAFLLNIYRMAKYRCTNRTIE